jgi:putative hydroxymethylpyrimidine transport system permease protein
MTVVPGTRLQTPSPAFVIPALRGAASALQTVLTHPSTVALVGLLFVWEACARLFALPVWLLPSPSHIVATLIARWPFLMKDAGVTALETILGLIVGVAIGMALALAMSWSRLLARALGPVTVVSQAIPFLALAPLMMVWLGFGMESKIAMAAITIFFSVTAAFHEGLKRADENLVELARLYGARDFQVLRDIRLPASLPHLCAGLKMAAAYAPMGAIAGEWVGSEGGLGIAMTYANARMQTDVVFAAMIILIVFSLGLWGLMSLFTRHLLRNFPDTSHR